MAQVIGRLSDAKVRAAKPRDSLFKLADGGGLFLWIMPTGNRVWRFRYVLQGKEKSLSIGAFPDVGLADARKRASAARVRLSEGGDPAADKQDAKRAATAAAVAGEETFEFIAREWHHTRGTKWTPKHRAQVLTSLEQDIFPEFGARSIREITGSDVLGALRKVEDRGALEIAGRIRQRVEAVFTYAIASSRASTNPAASLSKAMTERPKVRSLAALPPAEVPELLRKIEDYQGEAQTTIALRLLAYTFVRTSELRGATWAEINFDAAEWRIPEERMKARRPHVVPLSRQALEQFRELRVLNPAGDLCFPSRGKPRQSISENTVLYAIYRMGYHSRMTGHGFRSVASTMLNEMGYRSDVIEAQLAHTDQNEVRAAYNRATYMVERRTMLQAWADHLDALRDGTAENVIPIRRTAA